MFEFSLVSLVYRIAGDVWSARRKKQRRLSAHDAVQLRQKWKTEFETKLSRGEQTDVIIRDIRRMDSYPNTEAGKRISPWFKARLVGTYHRGIQLELRWCKLTMDQEKNKWRYTNYERGETGDIGAFLIGYIPYENIEAVDWEGDEYYGFPHIYCHFSTKHKEPYERLAFFVERHFNSILYYYEIEDFDVVHKMRKIAGVKSF
jgi:hypothetical protein